MRGRVLRRPLGGWRAREWRREVGYWLWAAFLMICAGIFDVTVYKLLEFLSQV